MASLPAWASLRRQFSERNRRASLQTSFLKSGSHFPARAGFNDFEFSSFNISARRRPPTDESPEEGSRELSGVT